MFFENLMFFVQNFLKHLWILGEDRGQFLFGVSYSQVQRGFPNNSLQVFAENYTRKTSPPRNILTNIA